MSASRGIPKPYRRRLISLCGFRGFQSQLNEGESLVLEYEGEYESQFLEITTRVQFDLVISGLDGCDIYGFWAMRSSDIYLAREMVEKGTTEEEYPIKTTIRRPVEDLVFGAILHGFDIDTRLEMLFGPYRRY